MRHGHVMAAQRVDFLVVQVDAVRHDRFAVPQQPVLFVHVRVRRAFGVQFTHPCDLAAVFRQMRLHRQIIPLRDFSESAHELGRGGWHETRRDNVADIRSLAAHRFDDGDGVIQGFLGAFAQFLGTVAIHVDLANNRPEPRFLREPGERQRGLAVQGRERAETQGAHLPHALDEAPVPDPRIVGTGESRLGGERVGLQPGKQFLVEAEPGGRILRGVDVQVVESRDHQRVAEVGSRHVLPIGRHIGHGFVTSRNDAVLHRDDAAPDADQPVRHGCEGDVADVQHSIARVPPGLCVHMHMFPFCARCPRKTHTARSCHVFRLFRLFRHSHYAGNPAYIRHKPAETIPADRRIPSSTAPARRASPPCPPPARSMPRSNCPR